MQIFINFFLNFTKFFDQYICAECPPPNRNFGDAIAVQDLRGIHVWNFFGVFLSSQNPGAASVYSTVYTVYLSVITCAPPPNFYSWRTPWLIATQFYIPHDIYAIEGINIFLRAFNIWNYTIIQYSELAESQFQMVLNSLYIVPDNFWWLSLWIKILSNIPN